MGDKSKKGDEDRIRIKEKIKKKQLEELEEIEREYKEEYDIDIKWKGLDIDVTIDKKDIPQFIKERITKKIYRRLNEARASFVKIPKNEMNEDIKSGIVGIDKIIIGYKKTNKLLDFEEMKKTLPKRVEKIMKGNLVVNPETEVKRNLLFPYIKSNSNKSSNVQL